MINVTSFEPSWSLEPVTFQALVNELNGAMMAVSTDNGKIV